MMPAITFQIHPFNSQEFKKNEEDLIHVLNKGYNVPRYEYNIITTPRIKHSLVEDLCAFREDQCYAVVCFANEDDNMPDLTEVICGEEEIDNAHITRSKLQRLYPELQLSAATTEYDVSLLPQLEAANRDTDSCRDLVFPDHFHNRFLGMGCLKPHGGPGGYELTGFVSFYPGVGSRVIAECESFAEDVLNAREIWITAIHEHQLQSMYEKWGYVFQQRLLVPVSADGDVKNIENGLENDVGASQDFHLDVLVKKY